MVRLLPAILGLILHVSAGMPGGGSLAQEVFKSVRTVNFDVRYQQGIAEADARKVADYLESDYEYLRKKLGIDLGRTIEVRIYDNSGRYTSAVKRQHSGKMAQYQNGMIHMRPVKSLEGENRFAQELSSGLAAAILELPGRYGCPAWLREAFGVYHSGKMAELPAPAGIQVRYFSDLDQEIQQYPDPPRRDEVEFLLGSTMKFLIDSYGEEKAMSAFLAFDGSRTAEEVLAEAFGADYESIERTWAKRMQSLVPEKEKER